jgi:hypothetical protein
VAQYGVAPEQSALVAHCPQRFLKHAGVDVPAQSALLAHCTHCCVVGSQTLCEVEQSPDVLQPTQAPVVTLQIRAFPSWAHCWLLVHAAWHWWSPGQQLGVVPLPQSTFALHCTQLPTRQKRADAGHCKSVVHATHPSAGSHCCPWGHMLPLPHSPLPTATAATASVCAASVPVLAAAPLSIPRVPAPPPSVAAVPVPLLDAPLPSFATTLLAFTTEPSAVAPESLPALGPSPWTSTPHATPRHTARADNHPRRCLMVRMR